MTPDQPGDAGPPADADPLETALAALDRTPVPDDGFTAAVMARLDEDAAADRVRAARWLARLEADRRQEARVRRYGLAGGVAGLLGVAVVAGGTLAAGPAAWSPAAVFALGLTTVVAAWLMAGRGG